MLRLITFVCTGLCIHRRTEKNGGAVTDTDLRHYLQQGISRLTRVSSHFGRMMQICDDTGAGMVYSDYFEKKNDDALRSPGHRLPGGKPA
ncbi:MAG: hypothetical protein MZV63_20885 [Marinilabiliales bacterium]|nr:hypothetical protein [Marinilabiliales bacterium]